MIHSWHQVWAPDIIPGVGAFLRCQKKLPQIYPKEELKAPKQRLFRA